MTKTIGVENFQVDVILNTVLDGLITIDEQGRILSFNPAAERSFSIAPTK